MIFYYQKRANIISKLILFYIIAKMFSEKYVFIKNYLILEMLSGCFDD